VRRAPGFASIVIVTLALGLGATTAVFGVLRSVVLAPLPYDDPERLIRLYQPYRNALDEPTYVTGPSFEHLRENTRSMEGVTAAYTYAATGADVVVGRLPERMRTLQVSSDYFRVLGTETEEGRTFAVEEERENVRVAVLSASSWRRLGGGAAWRSRSTIQLDGVTYDVIGIMPDEFEDPLVGVVDVWVPLALRGGEWENWEWDNHWLTVIGRLAPGVSPEAAQREVTALSEQQAELAPPATGYTLRIRSLDDDLLGNSDRLLYLLMGAVTFLLLIACVNIASLYLARSLERWQELAVRTVLGSTRLRLARQFILEALVLAAGGAMVGGVLAYGALRVLLVLAPVELRGSAPIDPSVFAFGLATALVCGLLFGAAPAVNVWRAGPASVLRANGRAGGSRGAARARQVLTVVQVALALVLVVGAGLLIASVRHLQEVDLGFVPGRALTFELNLPDSRYGEPAGRIVFHEELPQRLAELPGVRAAGAISWLPATGRGFIWGTWRGTATGRIDETFTSADQRVIAGDYFAATGMRILQGRTFRAEDGPDSPTRVIINQTLANRLFPDTDALSGRVWISGTGMDVVGIVSDAAHDARGETSAAAYHPIAQFAARRNWSMKYVVAPIGDAPGLERDVRGLLRSMDPELVVHAPEPLAAVVGRGTARERFAMRLLGAFAGIALVLATIGIYGVLANAVQRRRREIGIRLALGAHAPSIRRMVVLQGVMLGGLGITIGIAGALALSQLLESFLFGVSALDPRVFISGAAATIGIAAFASWLPSRAATRVSPAEAFRTDA
jgi:predicted permease